MLMKWLDNFKARLANKSAFNPKSEPILLCSSLATIPISGTDVNCLYDGRTYANYALVDLESHITNKRCPTIDQVLIKKYRHADISYSHIKELDADSYHLVILDATEDYILNYYPQNTHLTSRTKAEILHGAIQCLAFVKPDGTYFLALPMAISKSNMDAHIQPGIDIPRINTSVEIVNQVLSKINLSRTDGVYYPYLNYGSVDSISFSNIEKVKTFNEPPEASHSYVAALNFGLKIYLNDKMDVNLFYPSLDYTNLIYDYLVSNLRINFKSDGTFDLSLPHMNDFWAKAFQDFPVFNITDFINRDALPTDMLDVSNNQYMIKKVIQHNSSLKKANPTAFNSNDFIVENLNENSGNIIKPIEKATGLNEVLESMHNDETLKFYTYQDNIFVATDKKIWQYTL